MHKLDVVKKKKLMFYELNVSKETNLSAQGLASFWLKIYIAVSQKKCVQFNNFIFIPSVKFLPQRWPIQRRYFVIFILVQIWEMIRRAGAFLCTQTFISTTTTYKHFFFLLYAATQRGSWPPHSWGFLDHTEWHTTVGRTHLDEWSARRRELYLTHNTHNRQTSMPPVGLEPTISAGERPQTYALHRAAAGTGNL
jgi:hypothetical protein